MFVYRLKCLALFSNVHALICMIKMIHAVQKVIKITTLMIRDINRGLEIEMKEY